MSGRVGSITTDIIADGLVFNMDAANRASYPKTGTTATDTVNNNVGTLNGTTFISTTGSGIFDFDGADDYINCGNDSSLEITGNFTISAWVNLRNFTNSYNRLIGKANTANNRCNYGMGFYGYKPGIIANESGTWLEFPSGYNSTALSIGVWSHIIGVYDGTNVLFYINGSLDTTSSASGFNIATAASATSGQNLYIGANTAGAENFHGDIGPIQIYNRALSPTEILHNYNALKGRFGL